MQKGKLYKLLGLTLLLLIIVAYRTNTSAKEGNVLINSKLNNKTLTIKTDKVITSPIKQTFKLSFYTELECCNGVNYSGITASGDSLEYGIIASNVYPMGTKIYLEGYGEMIVKDRGGKHFNDPLRLDVYIPRNGNESDKEYKNRIMQLGRQEVIGWIIE